MELKFFLNRLKSYIILDIWVFDVIVLFNDWLYKFNVGFVNLKSRDEVGML